MGVISLLVLLLAACGEGTNGGSGTGDGSERDVSELVVDETREVGLADLVAPDELDVPDDLLIGVTFPHFRDPYWIAEASGTEERANELGIDIEITNAGGYGQSAEQIAQIESFITQGVDALIVGAVDATALAPTINDAWNRGIPVIYANALAQSDVQAGVYTNDCAVGELQAEYIAEQQPDAKIAMFTGPQGVSWPAARSDCFRTKLAEVAPNAEIVTEKFHEMDRAAILREMDDVLQAFPDVNFVYNNTDLQALGVVDSLRGAGKAPGEIRVTCLTLGREAYQALEAGWIEMALAERPALQGALAVDMAVRLLNGEELPARWEVEHPRFTADNLGEFVDSEAQWNWEPEGYQP